jgi:hypothetical protein
MSLNSLRTSAKERITDDTLALLHCRIASCGDISAENLHPFPVGDHGALLMHNGTLTSIDPLTDKGTDSEALAHWFGQIANLPELVADSGWVKFISPSKVTLMTVDANGAPRVTIFNKHLGTEYEGMWGSNSSAFKDYVPQIVGRKTNAGSQPAWWADTDQYGGVEPSYFLTKSNSTALTTKPSKSYAEYLEAKALQEEEDEANATAGLLLEEETDSDSDNEAAFDSIMIATGSDLQKVEEYVRMFPETAAKALTFALNVWE